MTVASAPGKAILLGEHAVVYGRPAIAVPICDRRAFASATSARRGSGVVLQAVDLGRRYPGDGNCVDDDGRLLQAALRGVLYELGVSGEGLDLEITIRSEIPIARGMGSGAAVSAALMRAVAQHLGAELGAERLSRLVFQTERLLHGTPSGIDNTTVAYEQPIWFVTGQRPEPIRIETGLTLLIGDTSVPARTHEAVDMVRARWQAARGAMEAQFDAIADIVTRARAALATGNLPELGHLMNQNQAILADIGVSSGALNRLIVAAREAGALGAKLSGGGMGGCMIALVRESDRAAVQQALQQAGAAEVITSDVSRGILVMGEHAEQGDEHAR
ncbi:MAG: mevalonate kinase [Anaerolineae bacterium]